MKYIKVYNSFYFLKKKKMINFFLMVNSFKKKMVNCETKKKSVSKFQCFDLH